VARPWQPLLDGALQARAHDAVAAIAAALDEREADAGDGPFLAEGDAGIALFHFYRSRCLGDAGAADAAHRALARAAQAIPKHPPSPALFHGFTGIAWVAAHFEARASGMGDRALTALVDETLSAQAARTPWNGPFDLISGLVGIGVYALERWPRAEAAACLERVLERLEELAQPAGEGGVCWHTPPRLLPPGLREAFPRGRVDLGMAHGAPGVIALLSAAAARGVAAARGRPLLERALCWLRRQERASAQGARFPYFAAEDEAGAGAEPARTSWCYGDLGVAAAVASAGRLLGDPSLEAAAIGYALRTARTPLEDSKVIDAGLCHGAVGVGHVLNRLFQRGAAPELQEAAIVWIERGLALRRPGAGVGGFDARITRDREHFESAAVPGFLTGAAGIGLGLLAALAPVEPEWDRLLLL